MRTFLIISLLFFVTFALGQSKANRLFNTAVSKYESGEYLKAAQLFERIVDNYKDFKYYDQSFYNVAYSYHKADSLNVAIEWYEKIRNSDLKDDAEVGGRGILEPYANYKHYSTFNIANIEYSQANYTKALDYYRQALNTYPYFNHSGTDIRINKNMLIICVTDCLEKLRLYEEALLTIVPEALDTEGSRTYLSVVNRAIDLVTEHFDKHDIKEELEIALKTLEQTDQNDVFMIEIRNKKIMLNPYSLENKTVDGLKKQILGSEFWGKLE